MPYLKAHRLTTGAVADTASKSDSYTSPHAYRILKVYITARGATALDQVQFQADIDGTPVFDPDIPSNVLEPENPTDLVLGLPFAKGSKFNYKLTNNSGASETYDITLILETESWPPA